MPNKMDTDVEDVDPFKPFKIDDDAFLNELDDRSCCPVCNKSRKYFCYTCYVPVKEIEGKIPKLKLPLKIDVIKHAREIDGKSTSSHVAVLAPDEVTIYTYPCVPEYSLEENVVLVFPGKNAATVANAVAELKSKNISSNKEKTESLEENTSVIHRAVFVDSTWNQSRGIIKDPRFKDLRCVVLENRMSQFWRHQEGSPRWYLATVEAVHEFLVELYKVNNQMEYDGRYDNLLFFFRFMYSKIHVLYDSSSLRAYKRPMFLSGIQKKKKSKSQSNGETIKSD